MEADLANLALLSKEQLEGMVMICAKQRLSQMNLELHKRLAITKYLRTVVTNMRQPELLILLLDLQQFNGYAPELEHLILKASEGYDKFMQKKGNK